MAVLWAFIPSEGIAFITDKFVRKVTELIIELPYSRVMENEADEVKSFLILVSLPLIS